MSQQYLGKISDLIPIEDLAHIVLTECRDRKSDAEIITLRILRKTFTTNTLNASPDKFTTPTMVKAIKNYRTTSKGLDACCSIIHGEIKLSGYLEPLVVKAVDWRLDL
jgi:hypothetical protein